MSEFILEFFDDEVVHLHAPAKQALERRDVPRPISSDEGRPKVILSIEAIGWRSPGVRCPVKILEVEIVIELLGRMIGATCRHLPPEVIRPSLFIP